MPRMDGDVANAAEDVPQQQSALVRELLARSEANREANRVAIENKYCARQSAMGVGACGDLDEETLREAFARSAELRREAEEEAERARGRMD